MWKTNKAGPAKNEWIKERWGEEFQIIVTSNKKSHHHIESTLKCA